MACNATEAGQIPPIEDLFLFGEREHGQQPPAAAGAAMLALISEGLFPGWALAFYDPLAAAGKGQPAPPRLALVAEDAILLAPEPGISSWRGFVIAEGQAQGQTRAFHWPGDPEPHCWLEVPRGAGGGGATWAEEAACLPIRRSPDTPEPPEPPPP